MGNAIQVVSECKYLSEINDDFYKKHQDFSTKIILVLLVVLFFVPTLVFADDKEKDGLRVWEIKGIAVTGPNDVCGVAQWMMPPPFPSDAHFTVVGQYDPSPDATNSIPLSIESCGITGILIATHSNPGLNSLGGLPDSDVRLKNVPLRMVSTKAFLDGTRISLPDMKSTQGNPFPPTKSEPNYPITVGDWFEASGEMKVTCYSDGSAKIKASFHNLIPNGVYGFFATWKTVLPGTIVPSFVPLAFGGVPNVIVPNEDGSAKFMRELSYCPMDPAPDGSVIMFVGIGYHADGTPNGALPQTITEIDNFLDKNNSVFQSAKPPGTVTLPHVQFPISIKPLS